MSKLEDKKWQAHAEQMAQAQQIYGEELRQRMAADSREEIIRIAGHFVDILAGQADDATLDPTQPDPAFARSPAGTPRLLWHKPGLKADMVVPYDAGEYVADKYRARPYIAFDAGFRAGVQAALKHLIDPAQFMDAVTPEIPLQQSDDTLEK